MVGRLGCCVVRCLGGWMAEWLGAWRLGFSAIHLDFNEFSLIFYQIWCHFGVMLASGVLPGGSWTPLGGHGATLGSSGSPLGGHEVAQIAKSMILLKLSLILKGPRGRPRGYGVHRPGRGSPNLGGGCPAKLLAS